MSAAPAELRRAGRRWWVTAFVVLFVAYQLPQLLVRVGVHGGIASSFMLVLFPLAAWLAWWRGEPFGRTYALAWRAHWWSWLVGLFILALAAKALAVVLGVRAGIYASHGPTSAALGPAGWAAVALITFVPSLAEDILTRGLWLHSPLARTGFVFVLGTAAVYTLNHVWRLALGPAEWAMLLGFGIAYGLAVWRTGTLWAALGLHWGWNFAGQALDAVWQVDVVDGTGAKLLSAAAHLVLALVVWVVTRGRSRSATGLDAGSGPA
ncbi:CPBP family intramembrane glutamic endopeptidase [Ramlibacter sp. MMS24-I3-19]|uniref:CPBP family intramembrane glutamic endopeptidase n=1 Tax=Ramlibacter sp. MMS24-I3-19 TaxID=3416606 RepID=UPI003CFCD410